MPLNLLLMAYPNGDEVFTAFFIGTYDYVDHYVGDAEIVSSSARHGKSAWVI